MDSEVTLSQILSKIQAADDAQIHQIITAVIRRYRLVFPDWEVFFLSLPKYDSDERIRIVESTLELLKTQAN